MARLKTGVLISGFGSNLQALLDATSDPAYPAKIVLVVSNRPDAFGLERARRAGVATAVIDHKAYADRAAFDAAIDAELTRAGCDFVCLAGFMRLLTPGFVERWRGRMINIHPSLLPAFRGLDPQGQAIRAGVKLAGATVHYVVPETDAGAIVAQGAVPVLPGDDTAALSKRILAVEHRIYPLALKLIGEGRIRLAGERAVIDTGPGDDGRTLLMPGDEA